MKRDVIYRGSTYLFIVLAVVLFIIWIKPGYSYPPKGIILPYTKSNKSLSAAQVKLYRYPPISKYKALAMVSVEKHAQAETNSAATATITYARQLASSIGANGLIIREFGFEKPSSSLPKGMAKFVLRGTAIYTSGAQ